MDENHFQNAWEEKERKRVSRRRWNGVFLAAVFIGGAYIFSNGSSNESTETGAGTEQVEAEDAKDEGVQVANVGDAVKLNDLTITTAGSEERDYLDGVETQGKVVLVDVTVQNDDNEARTISNTMFQLTVGGTTYDADTTLSRHANDGSSFFYDKVNPGLSLQSFVAFEVPPTLTDYDLLVTGGVGTEAGEQTLIKLH